MIRSDLIRHITKAGCTTINIDGTAKVLMFRNPKTGKESFVNLPADKEETWFNIERICVDLGIELPKKT